MKMCCQNKAHLRLVLPIQRIDNVSVRSIDPGLATEFIWNFLRVGGECCTNRDILKYQFIYVISDFD